MQLLTQAQSLDVVDGSIVNASTLARNIQQARTENDAVIEMGAEAQTKYDLRKFVQYTVEKQACWQCS